MTRSDTLSSLDPKAPLVLDIHELSRRPGSSRTVSRSVPAPVSLGIQVLEVPAGSLIDLELRLESVMEGVLVSGTARARTVGECARCLVDLEDDLGVDLQELYAYPESEAGEDEAGRVEDDAIDLEPLLRDALVLAMPFRPLCTEDCPGLCPTCGVRLAEDPAHGHAEAPDPRWAVLAGLMVGDGSAAVPPGEDLHDLSRPGTAPGVDEE